MQAPIPRPMKAGLVVRPMRAGLVVRPMRSGIIAALAGISVALISCGESNRPTEPSAGASDISGALASARLPSRRVTMMDACDPTTFNAAIGPGTCVRQGGVTFAKFVAQLTKHQKVGAWHNAPPQMTAREGQTLLAINRGGEVHTFTRVETFGGGIIPFLNQLSGTPVIAPECATLEPDDFVAPGHTYDEEKVGSAGTQRFQCCIHPWMRTVVHAH
jgi:hypothetical protein